MSTRTLVLFRTASGRYALPVEQVREVREARGLREVPRALPGVVGLLVDRDAERTVTVVEALGAGSEHVLVLEEPRGAFGLRVGPVDGLVRVDAEAVGPPPDGQAEDAVVGVVRLGGDLVLLVDAARLGRALFRDALPEPPG